MLPNVFMFGVYLLMISKIQKQFRKKESGCHFFFFR
jgi:hypothetical protein